MLDGKLGQIFQEMQEKLNGHLFDFKGACLWKLLRGDTALDFPRTALLVDGALGAWLVCLVSKEPL